MCRAGACPIWRCWPMSGLPSPPAGKPTAGRACGGNCAQGLGVGKERVRKTMKINGIRVHPRRRFKVTTDSNHNLPIAPNLPDRAFSVATPNKVWVGDITYVWTAEGWLYLATAIDLSGRQVAGFAMGERMGAQLVADALCMAWFRRRPAPGLIFHSDRGSQYAGNLFAAQIEAFKIRASMSRPFDRLRRRLPGQRGGRKLVRLARERKPRPP